MVLLAGTFPGRSAVTLWPGANLRWVQALTSSCQVCVAFIAADCLPPTARCHRMFLRGSFSRRKEWSLNEQSSIGRQFNYLRKHFRWSSDALLHTPTAHLTVEQSDSLSYSIICHCGGSGLLLFFLGLLAMRSYILGSVNWEVWKLEGSLVMFTAFH